MKKVFSLLLAGIMVLSMSGCSSGGDKEESKKEGNKEETVINFIDKNGTYIIIKNTGEGADGWQYGIADRTGKFIVDCKYEFLHRLAKSEDMYTYVNDGEVGVMDSKGTVKFKQKGTWIYDLDSDHIVVESEDENKIKLYDGSFNETATIKGKRAGSAKGSIFVERDGKVGVVDAVNGKELLPFNYSSIYPVTNGEGAIEACNDNNCSLFDKNMKEIVPAELMIPREDDYYGYPQALYFAEYIKDKNSYIVYKDDKVQMISADGKKQTIAVESYGNQANEHKIRYDGKYISVEDTTKTIYYNKDFNEVLSVEGSGGTFVNGIATLTKPHEGGGYTPSENKIIDEKGNDILSAKDEGYSEVRADNGYIFITDEKENKQYIMDAKKNKIVTIDTSELGENEEYRLDSQSMDKKDLLFVVKYEQEEDSGYSKAVSTTIYDGKGKKIADVVGRPFTISDMNYIDTTADEADGTSNTSYLYNAKGEILLENINGYIDVKFDDVIRVTDDDINILYDKETIKEICRLPKGYHFGF